MKKLFLALTAILCLTTFVVTAQNNNAARKSVVDSIAFGLLNRSSVKNTISKRMSETEGLSNKDAIVLEYCTHKLSSILLEGYMETLSDDELRRLNSLIDSKGYKVMMSPGFWKTYANYLYGAYLVETGNKSDFTYVINDERCLAAARMISDECRSILESVEKITQTTLAAIPNHDTAAIKRVMNSVPCILIKSMMEYMSGAEIESVDFAAFAMLEILDDADLTVKDSTRLVSFLSELNSDARLLDSVSRYVMNYRSAPERVDKHIENQKIVEKKYVYEGPVKDGIPHGRNGVMTDKKGVEYKGDFKNGRRHGLFVVTKPGKEPVTQVWIDDKLQKDIPCEPLRDGEMKLPGIYESRLWGYGYIYNSDLKTSMSGFFADGKLNGKGQIKSPDKEMEGVFENGELVNGTILWKSPNWKISKFEGRCVDGVSIGMHNYVSANGTYRKISRGAFVDGMLEGRGTVIIHDQKADMIREGVFVKDVMYGEGKVTRTLKTSKDGVNEQQIYEGWMAKGVPHGDGVVTITYANLPEKSIRMTRYGIKISPEGSVDAVVKMEGRFEYGKLVEGRVTGLNDMMMEGTFKNGVIEEGRLEKKYSDGSRYEGECRNGKYHGYGRLVYSDGTIYEGMFREGYRVDKEPDAIIDPEVRKQFVQARERRLGDEERVFRFDNLKVEKGVARLVRAAGVKILVRNRSSIQVVCNGRFEGEVLVRGRVDVSDGMWMEGDFEDGVLIKGRAKTEDKYGTIYVGEIKNGFCHGQGKCTYKNGTWFEGNFANGNRMDGTYYGTDGKVIKVYK